LGDEGMSFGECVSGRTYVQFSALSDFARDQAVHFVNPGIE